MLILYMYHYGVRVCMCITPYFVVPVMVDSNKVKLQMYFDSNPSFNQALYFIGFYLDGDGTLDQEAVY